LLNERDNSRVEDKKERSAALGTVRALQVIDEAVLGR
jgi:hypothetical protein